MKVLRFRISVLGMAAALICAGTGQGARAAVLHDEPLPMPPIIEKISRAIPTGYYGAAKKAAGEWTEPEQEAVEQQSPVAEVLAVPPPVSPAPAEEQAWNTLDHYDAANPSLPLAEETAPVPLTGAAVQHKPVLQPVKYNDSVSVFPVDDNDSGFRRPDAAGMPAGDMVQEVFFPHGSAAISKMDRRNLHELGASLSNTPNDYKLSVVGHASERVSSGTGPAKKELINDKMGQKRADAVTRVLKKAGVNPNRIVATSRGDAEPNAHPGDKSREDADRRVEVFMSTGVLKPQVSRSIP